MSDDEDGPYNPNWVNTRPTKEDLDFTPAMELFERRNEELRQKREAKRPQLKPGEETHMIEYYERPLKMGVFSAPCLKEGLLVGLGAGIFWTTMSAVFQAGNYKRNFLIAALPSVYLGWYV